MSSPDSVNNGPNVNPADNPSFDESIRDEAVRDASNDGPNPTDGGGDRGDNDSIRNDVPDGTEVDAPVSLPGEGDGDGDAAASLDVEGTPLERLGSSGSGDGVGGEVDSPQDENFSARTADIRERFFGPSEGFDGKGSDAVDGGHLALEPTSSDIAGPIDTRPGDGAPVADLPSDFEGPLPGPIDASPIDAAPIGDQLPTGVDAAGALDGNVPRVADLSNPEAEIMGPTLAELGVTSVEGLTTTPAEFEAPALDVPLVADLSNPEVSTPRPSFDGPAVSDLIESFDGAALDTAVPDGAADVTGAEVPSNPLDLEISAVDDLGLGVSDPFAPGVLDAIDSSINSQSLTSDNGALTTPDVLTNTPVGQLFNGEALGELANSPVSVDPNQPITAQIDNFALDPVVEAGTEAAVELGQDILGPAFEPVAAAGAAAYSAVTGSDISIGDVGVDIPLGTDANLNISGEPFANVGELNVGVDDLSATITAGAEGGPRFGATASADVSLDGGLDFNGAAAQAVVPDLISGGDLTLGASLNPDNPSPIVPDLSLSAGLNDIEIGSSTLDLGISNVPNIPVEVQPGAAITLDDLSGPTLSGNLDVPDILGTADLNVNAVGNLANLGDTSVINATLADPGAFSLGATADLINDVGTLTGGVALDPATTLSGSLNTDGGFGLGLDHSFNDGLGNLGIDLGNLGGDFGASLNFGFSW